MQDARAPPQRAVISAPHPARGYRAGTARVHTPLRLAPLDSAKRRETGTHGNAAKRSDAFARRSLEFDSPASIGSGLPVVTAFRHSRPRQRQLLNAPSTYQSRTCATSGIRRRGRARRGSRLRPLRYCLHYGSWVRWEVVYTERAADWIVALGDERLPADHGCRRDVGAERSGVGPATGRSDRGQSSPQHEGASCASSPPVPQGDVLGAVLAPATAALDVNRPVVASHARSLRAASRLTGSGVSARPMPCPPIGPPPWSLLPGFQRATRETL